MKKAKALSILFVLCTALFCLSFSFQAGAATPRSMDEAKTAMQGALKYRGMSMRLSGDTSGIRSLWEIDNTVVKALEDEGFTVTYGAIMGIASANETANLTVVPHDYLGYTMADSVTQSACAVVYATTPEGGTMPSYASNTFTSTSTAKNTFAYTTLFGGEYETEAYYNLKMVYRAFFVLEKDEVTEYGYVDMVPDQLPATVSLADMSSYFYNTYDGVDKATFKGNRLVLRVYALTGGATLLPKAEEDQTAGNYELLTKEGYHDTYKLASGKTFLLTANVPATGFYKVTAKMNRENNYIGTFATIRPKTEAEKVYVSEYRIGTSGSASTETASGENAYLTTDSSPVETLGYQYLFAGDNTLTFQSTAAVGLSDFALELMELPIDKDNSMVIHAQYDSTLIKYDDGSDSTCKNKTTSQYGSDRTYGLQFAKADTVSYTVTPKTTGIYRVAVMANLKNGMLTATATDKEGNAQTVSDIQRGSAPFPAGGSTNVGYAALSGELYLIADTEYTLKLALKGDTGNVQMITHIILQNVGSFNPNESQLRVNLMKDGATVTGGTNTQLLSDNKTYFLDGASNVSFSIYAPADGIYGYRFLETSNNHRVDYTVTTDKETYLQGGTATTPSNIGYNGRITGDTNAAYTGTDFDSFLIDQSLYKSALAGSYYGYVYLHKGANTISIAFAEKTALGLASVEFALNAPFNADKDIRIKLGETSDWVDGDATPSSGEGLNKNNMQGGYYLALGSETNSSVTATFTVTQAQYYYVYALAGACGPTGGNAQLAFNFKGKTDTTFEKTVTYTHTERYMAIGEKSSTSVSVKCTDAVYFPAGEYTVTFAPVNGWVNIVDIRLDMTGELTYVEPTPKSCTTDGNIGYYYQAVSGKYFRDKDGLEETTLAEVTIPADGSHVYKSWEVETEPTLYTTGTLTRQCLGTCGEKESFTLPCLSPLNEYWLTYEQGETKGVKNTPTEGGHGWYKYKKDGQVFLFETDLPSLDTYYNTLTETLLVKAEELTGTGSASFDADSHTLLLNTPSTDTATFTVNAPQAGFYSLYMKYNNEGQKVKLTVTNKTMTDSTLNSPSLMPLSENYDGSVNTYLVPTWEYNADFSTTPVSYVYLKAGENEIELKAYAYTSGGKLGISDLFLRAEQTLEGVATDTVVYPTTTTTTNGWRTTEKESNNITIPFSVSENGTYKVYALLSTSGASVLLDSETASFPGISLEMPEKASGNSLGDQQKSLFYAEVGSLQLTAGNHTARFTLKKTNNGLDEYLHIGLLAFVRTGDLVEKQSLTLDFDKKLDPETQTLTLTANLSGLVPGTSSPNMKVVFSGYYTQEGGIEIPFSESFNKTSYNQTISFTTDPLTGNTYGVTYQISVYNESETQLLYETEKRHYSIDDTLTIFMMADLHYTGSNLTQYLRNYKYNPGDGYPTSYQERRYVLKERDSYRTSYEAYGWTSDEKEQRVIDDIIMRYQAGEFDLVIFLGDQGMADGNYYNFAPDHVLYADQPHFGRDLTDFWDSPLNLDYMMHVNYMSQLSAEGIPYINCYGNHEYLIEYNEDKTDVSFQEWENLHHYQELFGHKDADGNIYDATPNQFFVRVIRDNDDGGKVKFVSALTEDELRLFKDRYAGDGNCYDYYISEESVTDEDIRLGGMLILSQYQFEDYDEYMKEYVFKIDPSTGDFALDANGNKISDYHAQTIRMNYHTEDILEAMDPMLDEWGNVYMFSHNFTDSNGALSDLFSKHPNIQAMFMGDVHTETYNVMLGLVPKWVAGCWSVAYDADYYEEKDPETGLSTGVKDSQYYYYKNGYEGHTIGGDYRYHPFAYMTLHIKGSEAHADREHAGFFYENTEPQYKLFNDRVIGKDAKYVRAVDYTHEAGTKYTVGNHTVYVGGDSFLVGDTHLNLASSYTRYKYNKPEYVLAPLSGLTYTVCDTAGRPLNAAGVAIATLEEGVGDHTPLTVTLESTDEGRTTTVFGTTYYIVSTSGGVVGHYLYDENGDFVYQDTEGNLVFFNFKKDAQGNYIKEYFYEKKDGSWEMLGDLVQVPGTDYYEYTLRDGTYTDMWLSGDPMTVSALDSVTDDDELFSKVTTQYRIGKFCVSEGEIKIENGIVVRGLGFMNFGYAYDLVYADGSLADLTKLDIQQKETFTYTLNRNDADHADYDPLYGADLRKTSLKQTDFTRTDNGLQDSYGYYQPRLVDEVNWIDR